MRHMVPPDTTVVLAASRVLGHAIAGATRHTPTRVIEHDEITMLTHVSTVIVAFDRESDLNLVGEVTHRWPEASCLVVYDARARHFLTRAVRSYCVSALAMDELELVDDVLGLVAKGHAVLPADALGEISRHEVPPLGLTSAEIGWLIQLRSGTTVAALARTAGYSERSMHRRLHDLYGRIGVAGRGEALRMLE